MTRMIQSAATFALVAMLAPAMGAAQTHSHAEKPMKDIVTVAVEAGTFKTLVAAVQAAGLVEVLQGEGPFTVFAPTDAAFAKLPAGTVEALLADREKLTAILTYHVVSGRIEAGDIVRAGRSSPTTVQGQSLNVRVENGSVLVDGATVVTADIGASNGVIHVIDTVILPRAEPAPAGGR
ncbi:fasciclin domain-containing protein [soil metagenome]